jgi:hypothetical protein
MVATDPGTLLTVSQAAERALKGAIFAVDPESLLLARLAAG